VTNIRKWNIYTQWDSNLGSYETWSSNWLRLTKGTPARTNKA